MAGGVRKERKVGHAAWLGALLALGCMALLAIPGRVEAQTLEGRVMDESGTNAVPSAAISLVDRDGETVVGAIADSVGRFRLVPPRPGEFYIVTTGIGYETSRSPLVAFDTVGVMQVELVVTPAPLGLEGLEVSVEAEAETMLGNIGVSPASLSNRWIDRNDVDAMETPGLTKDVIRWQNIAGVYIDEYDSAAIGAPLCVRFQRRSRACAVTVLDGVVVSPERAFSLNAKDIEAIAILQPTEASTFYGTAGGGGAVLIWTRAGR